MNVNRRHRVLLMGALLSGAFTAGAYAQDVLQSVQAYLRPDFNVVINGTPVKLERSTLVYEDTSYLPLKEISKLLGANVIWRGDTNTIYINSLLNSEQKPNPNEEIYGEIKLYNPTSVTYRYLGAEYPVMLTNDDPTGGNYSYDLYYRLSDVRRMGIDTSGLKKVRDRITYELFVSEKELAKTWKEQPTQVYSSEGNYVISGEVHTKKLAMIRDHLKSAASLKVNNELTLVQKPIYVEKRDDSNDEFDYYNYYFQETTQYIGNNNYYTANRYYRGILKLVKGTVEGQYSIFMTDKTDLESEANKRATGQK
ncbi:stalk domain-containing protein [Paenibacillus silviterrae]|uniref:stalk domain-containing protein n=1 Tax=Paenibacillus silviterrae TaxID=3242194 RepID=UPI00254292B2|nr:stalk domain-containing protein [Paenibacillus chinjuensis]